MGTYADALRELADLLDEDFNKNRLDVCEELLTLVKSLGDKHV